MNLCRTSICVFLFSCANSYADWRLDAFSKAQAILRQFDESEAALMTKLAPETKPFYVVWIPAKEARRKLEDIAFRRRIRHDPASITWDDPWIWSEGIRSTAEEKKLAAEDKTFAEAYHDYSAKRALLLSRKELFKARNAAYEKHKETFRALESELQVQLKALQLEVERHKKT